MPKLENLYSQILLEIIHIFFLSLIYPYFFGSIQRLEQEIVAIVLYVRTQFKFIKVTKLAFSVRYFLKNPCLEGEREGWIQLYAPGYQHKSRNKTETRATTSHTSVIQMCLLVYSLTSMEKKEAYFIKVTQLQYSKTC